MDKSKEVLLATEIIKEFEELYKIKTAKKYRKTNRFAT